MDREKTQIKKKKRRKKKNSAVAVVVTLLVSVLIAVGGALTYSTLKLSSATGTYVRTIDYTDSVVKKMVSWIELSAQASIDEEGLKEDLANLDVNIIFELKKDSLSPRKMTGEYAQYIDEKSYEECRKRAYDKLSGIMRDLIKEELQNAGYTGDMEDADIDKLIADTLGMGIGEYLESQGLELIKSYEELNADIQKEGSFVITHEKISFDEKEESIGWSNDYIVLPDENVIYTKIEK